MKNGLFISIFLLLTVFSCSKGANKVEVKINNKFSLSSMPGGAMLYIENLDIGAASSVAITGETHSVILPNGNWRFTVVGWEDVNPLSGTMDCGFTTARLDGTSSTVNIDISSAACDSLDFNPPGYRVATNPLELDFVTCKSIGAVASGADDCNSDVGLSKSYRLRILEYDSAPINNIAMTDKGLSTKCIPGNSTLGMSLTSTNHMLPYGRGDGLFAYTVEAFSDLNCTAGLRKYFFPRGLANLSAPNSKVFLTTSPRVRLYLQHGGIALSGNGVFAPTIGSANLDTTIKVMNNSGQDMTLVGLNISGAPFDWTGGTFPGTSGSCILNSVLTDGTFCMVQVNFTSSTVGKYSKVITMNYRLGAETTSKSLSLPLTGSIVTPALLTLTGNPSFGNIGFGTTGVTRNFTIKNTGGIQTWASTTSVTAPYSVVNSCDNVILQPGESCTFGVSLDPNYSPANYALDLNILYGTGISWPTIIQPLTGTIVDAGNAVVPANYNFAIFPINTTNLGSVTLTNNTTIAITSLSFSGFNSTFQKNTTTTCTTSLAPGASCDLKLKFIPTTKGPKSKTITVSYYNGFSTVTKTIGLTGEARSPGPLAHSPTNFGDDSYVNGGSWVLPVTIMNDGYNMDATVFSPTVVGSGFSVTFPSGDCTATIAAGSSCTFYVSFNPTVLGNHNGTLKFDYNNGGGAVHEEFAISAVSTTVAGLVISGGASFDFEARQLNQLAQQSFTISNNGGAEAIFTGFSSLSAPFSRTHNCGASLPPNGTCQVTVNFTPTQVPAASDSLIVQYNNGMSNDSVSKSVSGSGILVANIQPFYSNAPNWNHYVVDSTLGGVFNDNNTRCIAGTHPNCHHAGELRKIVIPDLNSCSAITISEHLNAFDWDCIDFANAGPVTLRGRLKKNKGLRDLVDATQWKGNLVSVFNSGVEVFRHTNNQWWMNGIRNIDELGSYAYGDTIPTLSGGQVVGQNTSASPTGNLSTWKLQQPEFIYVASSNTTLAGLILGAGEVSLVTINGAEISLGHDNNTCNSTTISAASPDTNAVVCGGLANFNWIEAKVRGFSNLTDKVLFLKNANFITIRNSTITFGNECIEMPSPGAQGPSLILNSFVSSCVNNGLLANSAQNLEIRDSVFSNMSTGYGISLNGTGGNNVIEDTTVHLNYYAGINITGSNNNNRLNRVSAFNTLSGAGIRILTNGNVLKGIKTGGNHGDGLNLNGSSSMHNKVVGLLSVQNSGYGLNVDNVASRNTIVNATIANNYKGATFNNSTYNTLVNSVIFNSYGLYSALHLNNASQNFFSGLAVAQGDVNIRIDGGTNNTFTKTVTGDNRGSYDCMYTSVGVGNTMNGVSMSAFDSQTNCDLTGNLSLATDFVGNITTDSVNTAVNNTFTAFNSIQAKQFSDFMNPFRFWGPRDTTAPIDFSYANSDNSFFCGPSMDCLAYDWRFVASGALVDHSETGYGAANETFVANSVCPSAVEGSVLTTDSFSTPNTFLSNATEINDDGAGNEDGLCQNGEACLYTPNYGIYQGEGNLVDCNFQAGTFTSVTMKAFQSFSAIP